MLTSRDLARDPPCGSQKILSPRIDMNAKLAVDLCVLLLYFFVIIFIGLRMGRKEDNLHDFALGGRQIPW